MNEGNKELELRKNTEGSESGGDAVNNLKVPSQFCGEAGALISPIVRLASCEIEMQPCELVGLRQGRPVMERLSK